MTAAGAATVNPYVEVGPTFQTLGYGWGTSTWRDSTWGTERDYKYCDSGSRKLES